MNSEIPPCDICGQPAKRESIEIEPVFEPKWIFWKRSSERRIRCADHDDVSETGPTTWLTPEFLSDADPQVVQRNGDMVTYLDRQYRIVGPLQPMPYTKDQQAYPAVLVSDAVRTG